MQGVQRILEVTHKRIIKGKEQLETLYYILSLTPDILQISDAIRGNWDVENKIHWVLDATGNVNIIKRFVLNFLRSYTSKNNMHRKLKRAKKVDESRTEIIFG